MKSRVLVVDDDPALAEMLTIVLRGEGFDTAVVGDGTRALPAVRELRPDVVLLDLMLPGMNGIDVCRAIRSESGVPIVMLTAKQPRFHHVGRRGDDLRLLRVGRVLRRAAVHVIVVARCCVPRHETAHAPDVGHELPRPVLGTVATTSIVGSAAHPAERRTACLGLPFEMVSKITSGSNP